MRRILVATDGSPDANRAVTAAARLAKAIHGELSILTIGGSISGSELRHLAGTDGDLSATMKAAANKVLEQARKCALRAGVAGVKMHTEWGDPAERIIESTRRHKTDILVVGRRGRGRLSALLLGSVSQKLASLAPCAVMVVP
jgi:nucleotide-binding universal stress UspA family protein